MGLRVRRRIGPSQRAGEGDRSVTEQARIVATERSMLALPLMAAIATGCGALRVDVSGHAMAPSA